MPTFTYTARDPSGQERSGLMQAESEAAVIRTLDQQSLFPVAIVPATTAAGRRRRGGKVRLRDLGTAYSQLADLLTAGVPLLRGLDILARTAVNRSLGTVLEEVRDGVSAGETLADSFAKHPAVFSELHVAMTRAGETAGFLEDVLKNLAEFLERQDELRGKVRGAMVYPLVLSIIAAVVVTGMLLFFVPMFKGVLGEGQDLPLPSRILFALSDALRYHAWLLLAAGAAAVFAIRSWLRSESGRAAWSRWQLKMPLAGKAIRMVSITRFCRVLGTMLANGVPIVQALTISKDAAGNLLMARAIDQAAENVRAGEALAEPLRKSGLFPPEIIEMIAVGEESNQLERVLVETANAVERRTNRQVDTAVRLVEPLMLVLMAVAIGFIALGLLYPIFNMSSMFKM